MFDFEARVVIGWLVNTLESQPMRTRASMSNIFAFMLRWPTFLTASILHLQYDITCCTTSFVILRNVLIHITCRMISRAALGINYQPQHDQVEHVLRSYEKQSSQTKVYPGNTIPPLL